MKKVSHILKRKGSNVITITPDITVLDALKEMAEKNIGSIVVLENGEYAGLLTERDYARKVILKGKSSTSTFVKEIMSTGLPRITPDNSIETCMQIMSENNIRYLPVFKTIIYAVSYLLMMLLKKLFLHRRKPLNICRIIYIPD